MEYTLGELHYAWTTRGVAQNIHITDYCSNVDGDTIWGQKFDYDFLQYTSHQKPLQTLILHYIWKYLHNLIDIRQGPGGGRGGTARW